MFRRLTNRVSSALGAGGRNENGGKVRSLVSMGFQPAQARNALEATGGDVEQAAGLLLASGGSAVDTSNNVQNSGSANSRNEVIDLTASPSVVRNDGDGDDDQMRIALQKSLESAEKDRTRRRKEKQTKKKNAAEVAAQNHRRGFDEKVHTPLDRRSADERIPRLAGRLTSHPRAVDTLLVALKALLNDPTEAKYRTVDRRSRGYVETFPPNTSVAAAAEDLLAAVGFVDRRDASAASSSLLFVMESHRLDVARLRAAVVALERTRAAPEYAAAKRERAFRDEVRVLLGTSEAAASEAEIAARLARSRATPREPAAGADACSVSVRLTPERTVVRRFDGDDQLRDVLSWLGGALASELPRRLETGEWDLVDRINHGARLDCVTEKGRNATLQRLGCWPSARLELAEGRAYNKDDDDDEEEDSSRTATRGLGTSVSVDSGKGGVAN